MANQQKFTIKVSKKYEEAERLAIGLDVIDQIVKRTQSGKDKKGKDFKQHKDKGAYSESYRKSLDFKLAGKSNNKVNLTLSGEMLGALEVLETKEGEIVIGIPENDSFNNAKAEGHITGNYGGKQTAYKRDFLGVSRKELSEITGEYPINNNENRRKTRERALELLVATEIAADLVDELAGGVGSGS